MKVKCVNIYNVHTKQYQDKSSWLTVGKEYVVLEILIRPEKDVLYRLVGDNQNQMPILFDARQFEITSGKVVSNWTINQLSDMLFLSPHSWSKSGFWEQCYDNDPTALDVYKREARIIMEEES